MNKISKVEIEKCIFIARKHKVMLDIDLARIYGVETRTLNQAVKRNPDRFPNDFMFQLNIQLREFVISHSELSKKLSELEKKYDSQFKVVFQAIEQLMVVPEVSSKMIGI